MTVKVIATYKTAWGVIALLEKTVDSPERYIIAHDWDARTRSWSRGEYRSDQIDAMKLYITRATK